MKRIITILTALLLLQLTELNAAEPPNSLPDVRSWRPKTGKFPPLEKAHSYRGELVFVDHANRRGSIRIQGEGKYFRNKPHPFAMLPYGIIRYHNAPAQLLSLIHI